MTTTDGLDRDLHRPLSILPLVAAAWVALLAGALSGSRVLDHDAILDRMPIEWTAVVLFLLAWQLVVVAAVLPANLAAVRAVDRPGTRGPFLAGFAVPWTVFAAAALGVDFLVHHTVESQSWLEARPFLVAAGLIAVVGLAHLSPARRRSLAARRAWASRPTAFGGGRHAAREGTRYGLLSLRCDAPLVFLMFGLGRGSVAWMAGICLLLSLAGRRTIAAPEHVGHVAPRARQPHR